MKSYRINSWNTLKKVFFTLCLCVSALSAFAQEGAVTGTVIDETGATMPGVNVMILGTTTGVVTDVDGKFSINASPTDVLQVSFVGYTTQEIAVGDQRDIEVSMSEGQQLEEVVVTAMGMSKERKKLGYSVSEIKAHEITLAAEVSTVNALQGRVAGLHIDGGAGGPMGGSRIQIRGNSTLGRNNQPIFVIDGVIIDNEITGSNDFSNDLKNLNMEDYETISVLKGSSAAALYGSRAINGVILITTKKGKKRDGLGVNFTQSATFYDPYKGPKFQNEYGGGSVGAFFTDWRDQGYKANEQWRTKVFPTNSAGEPYIDPQIGREAENWGPRFNGQQVRNYDGTWTKWEAKPNNFLDAFQMGHSLRSNISVDGGTEKATFRASYTYENNKGVTPRNKMIKNAINMRVTYDVNSYLGFDASVDNTYTNSANPERTGLGDRFMYIYPRNFDTKYWTQRQHYVSGMYGGVPNPNGHSDETNRAPGLGDIFSLYENSNTQDENTFRGRLAMNVNVTEWLKVVLEGNVNNLNKKREGKELGVEDNFAGGSYSIYQSQKQATFFKGYVAASKSFDDFNISGYIGAETNRSEQTYTQANTEGGLNNPGKYYISNSKDRPSTTSALELKKRINSIYASFDADYRNQLFLQATWRADWSSALVYPDGSGNPAYNYPAVSLAWAFTETFSLPQFITYGKLRANIAALGKDTDPYRLNPGYKFSGDYAYNQSTGSDVSKVEFESTSSLSLNIKPERKIAKEIGLEMKFFGNRLGFDFSFYRDNTYDQIMPLPTPPETGVAAIFINAGNIQNTGVEFTLDYTPVRTSNFEWYGSFNISRNRNKIIELYEGRNEYDLGEGIHTMSSYAVVGKSYGIIRTNAHSKAFQAEDANGNPVAHPNNGQPVLSWRSDARAAWPGRSGEWMDVGDINPDFRGGLNNTFRYKNLSFQFLIDAKVGGDMALYSYSFGTHTGLLPNTLAGRDAAHGGITWTSGFDGETYDDGMIPEGVFPAGQTVDIAGGGTADVGGMTYREAYNAGLVEPTHTPQFFYRYGSWSTGPTDYWVFKDTWVALRQVALSYRFPASVCSTLHVKGLDLGIYGRDLGYLYSSLPYDFNPASNNSNSTASVGEAGFLPMIRSFGATLRLTF